MSKKRSYGALPPEEWMIGKTLPSIKFVQEAEQYIKNSKNQYEIMLLKEAIEQIKHNLLELKQMLSPKDFLKSDT